MQQLSNGLTDSHPGCTTPKERKEYPRGHVRTLPRARNPYLKYRGNPETFRLTVSHEDSVTGVDSKTRHTLYTRYADLKRLALGRGRISVAGLISILRLPALLRLRRRSLERLLEVGNDVVNMLGTDRDTDEVL